jgi:hypothetical protein
LDTLIKPEFQPVNNSSKKNSKNRHLPIKNIKMATWQDRAQRGLTLFEGSPTEEGDRTWQIFNHVLDENNFDDYISNDFFNVQQTAGGLPDGMTFDDYLSKIVGRVRSSLEGENFDENRSDDEFRQAALTFDDNIRRHIRFLNGTVHQAAPGEVHVNLWNYILAARGEDKSIYSCYRDYLVDA